MKNVIIFEGPDCCGKTTQINKLAKKLRNCIVIHSPRKDSNTTRCFKLTTNTLYNKDFMNKLFTDFNEHEFFKLKTALTENLNINHKDRIHIVEQLNNIYKGLLMDFDFTVKEDYKLFYDGEFLDTDRKSQMINYQIMALLDMFEKHPEECYVILDRFHISGYVYNYYIPIHVINEYKNEHYHEISGKVIDTINELEKTILEIEKNSAFEINRAFLDYDIITFVFKSSDVIKNMYCKDDRKYDAYDNDNYIQKYSKTLYNEEVYKISDDPTSKRTIIVDTDSIYYQNEKIEDVEEFIYNQVKAE